MEIIFRIGMIISLLSCVFSLFMVCKYRYRVIKQEKIQKVDLIKIHPVIIIDESISNESISNESIVIAEPIQPNISIL